MIKIYCDECGREFDKDRVGNRIKFKTKSGRQFELIVSNKESVWNAGHLCTYCIKKLISNAERV